MLWRDNKGKNQTDNKTETGSGAVSRETMSREEIIATNDEARKVYEEIMALRKSVETLKSAEKPVKKEAGPKTEKTYASEPEDVIAAQQAIIDRAKQDAERARLIREEQKKKLIAQQQEKERVLAAQKHAAQVAAEAERKRIEAAEAERKAKELSHKQALEAMEHEMLAKKAAMTRTASKEEMAEFFDEKKPEKDIDVLNQVQKELLSAQKQQHKILDKMSTITEKNTEKLAEVQQEKITHQQEKIAEEQHKLEVLLDEQKQIRKEKTAKAEADKRIKEQKALVERMKKEEKIRKRKEEKAYKAAEKERIRREKKDAHAKLKEEEAKKRAEAELGGGIVNVHNVQISTTIKKVAHFSWKDLLGIVSKKEKNAQTEAERAALKKERERRRETSRALAVMLRRKRWEEYAKSKIGKKYHQFTEFCDAHKVGLLTAFAIILVAAVGTAGVFNYCTAYEYSYNGKALGLVKSKDDVLKITDLVQAALTEEKNMEIVVDAKEDIKFDRVRALGNVKIDTSEDVLRRLTYMGDLNVKACGIYVNGKKVGAVQDEEVAKAVLEDIVDKYTIKKGEVEVEGYRFRDELDVKTGNSDLQDLYTRDEMVEKLCTSGYKESIHTVEVGETLADVATIYSMKEEEILEDNPNVDPTKLEVGSKIVIKQNAPVINVEITEVVKYDETIKYEVKKIKDKDIYEGYDEVTQNGKNGKNEVTARIVSVNGGEIERDILEEKVIKKPVKKIIHVGVKERPPTVGSGKYIWPMESSYYTVTSEFGPRWGRNHNGIDLGCPTGSPVLAADGGTVTQAGYSGSFGYLVVIDHQNGMETYYAHNSELHVSVGDKVFQGQHISNSGNTGRSTGPHLHFEIRVNGSPTNPRNYLP